jgi:hypothetical protein
LPPGWGKQLPFPFGDDFDGTIDYRLIAVSSSIAYAGTDSPYSSGNAKRAGLGDRFAQPVDLRIVDCRW